MTKTALYYSVLLGMASLSADIATEPMETSQESVFNKMPKQEITPPIVSSGMKIETSADFIWWKTTIDGLEYVASGVHNGNISVGAKTSVSGGEIKSASFDYQPGFKIGLGFLFDHDGWDIRAEYTWLNPNTQSNSVSLVRDEGLVSSYGIVESAGAFGSFDLTNGSSAFTHHFNVVDLMLGRDFFVSKWLSLKPQLGAKVSWTKDEYDLHYTAYYPGLSSTDFALDFKQKMLGAGIRAGMGSFWRISEHFGLYGNLMFSGLWSYFKSSESQEQGSLTTCKNKENMQKIVNIVEYGIGLGYATWFCQDACQFSIKAGWEQQIWLGYNNLIDVNYVTTGNLNMQGLTTEVGFAF